MTEFPFDRRELLKTTGAGVLSAGAFSTPSGANQTDREVWRFGTGLQVRSSPTVVDGTVFIGSLDNNVYALDAATGEKQWQFGTGDGVWSSPTVVDGTLYVGSWDSNVYALDAATGEKQWQFETGNNVWSSPTVVDDKVFVGSHDGNLYALDAGTGDSLWQLERDNEFRSSVTVADGTVFVGLEDSYVYALDPADRSVEWSYTVNGSIQSSPTVFDGTVLVGTDAGYVYGISASGGVVQWRFQTFDSQAVTSSPTAIDGTVFVGSLADSLYALDAGTGDLEWDFVAGDEVRSSPTVVGNTVFVGSRDETVYAIDATTGDKQWGLGIGDQIWSSPTVVDGTVFVGCDDNNVYALDAGVSGSSEGTRVTLGTLGHHHEWANRGTTFESTPQTPTIGEQITFDASGIDGTINSYNWAFGDGGTATGEVVTQSYETTGSYNVELTLDRPDEIGTVTQTIEVVEEDNSGDAGVTANFDYTPAQPTTDDQLVLDASPTQGTIDTYEWIFGLDRQNPPTATGKRVNHSFETAGSYTLQLRVAGRPADDPDAQMTVDTTTATVVVESADDGTTISDISVSPTDPTVGTSVTFGVQTGDDDPQVDWTFGDESTATGQTVTHTYEQAGTYQIQATTPDGASASTEVEVGDRPIEVTDLSRRLGGELLPGLPVDETVEATVDTKNTTLDRVEFDYDGETTTSDSRPHDSQFDVGTFDAPGETITIRAIDTNGVVDREPTEIPVTDLTPWLEFLLGLDEVLTVEPIVTEDGVTIDILYDPLGALDVGIELPEDVAGSSADASDRTQSFGFGGIDFGGSYDPIARSARLRGAGEITATMMRADVTAGVRASGTVTSDLELIDPVGGVSAEAEVTIPSLGPVPMSIPIPGTNSTIGIEPTITPGIDGEFRFSNEFDFQDGTITPSIAIRIETGVEVESPVGFGSVGLSVATEGDLDIEFEVGNGEPEPLGEITITGEVSLALGLEFVIEGEIISATFGPGAQSQQILLTDGLEYELRQSSTGGKQALPEVDSVDSGAVAAAATDPLSTTETGELYRLTDREYEDTEPAVAVLDDGTYMVAWSQQAADKPADAGRDLVVRTYDGGSWSDPTILTDDSTSDTEPVAAATADGRVLVAWITYTVDATESDVDPDRYLASAELVYAVYDGSSWSEPTTLTDTDVRQQRPSVAADENGWLLAWQALDTSGSTPATTVRAVRIADATTDPTVENWAEGASPDLGERTDDGVSLAYVRTSGDSVTGVVHQHVIGTSVDSESSYDAADAGTVATSNGRLVWSAGSQDARRIVDAAGGSPTELDVREEVTTVGELDLSTVGDRTVLSYRASFTDSENRDLVYRLDRGNGWIRDRRIAGGPAREETLWHSETAPLPTSDAEAASFVTAYAVSDPSPDAVDDVFVTQHGFAPDYALDGATTIEAAPAGEETTVSYTIENRGDVAGSEPITITIEGAGSTTIEEPALDTGASVSGTATVTVPEDGIVDCSLSVDEAMLGTEPTERTLVAATPTLRVADVSAIRRGESTADLTITVRNVGDAAVDGVPITVIDGGRQVLTDTIDRIDPGTTASLETAVDPTALSDDTPQEVVIDPDRTLPKRAIGQRRQTTPLVRPNLTLEEIRYREDSDVTFVSALVSNRGAGAAEGTYRLLAADGTVLAGDRLAVAPAIDGEPRYDQVTVRAAALSPDTILEHRVETTVGNVESDGLVRTDTVEAILPTTLLTAEQYATPDGRIELGGLRTAISDWQADRIGTDVLTQLLDAWSNGEPVE